MAKRTVISPAAPRQTASVGPSLLGSNDDLPPGWHLVRFDEMAESIGDRVEPGEADTEFYVGLEHLDTDSLKLRRWGNPGDVEATKLRFRTGDIIFGKRRVYQRKLAVAEFDGICSAHAMVIRAKQDVVDPTFLPFLMQSDAFMERALAISVGSLSPTINWSTLARQTFPLPPLGEQQRIAEILSAANEAVENYREGLEESRQLAASISERTIKEAIERANNAVDGWHISAVSELCSRVSVGIVVTPAKYYRSDGVRCLRSANVRRGYVQDAEWVFISEEAHRQHAKSALCAGDVLVVRSGVYAGMSCVLPESYDGANCIDIVFATPNLTVLEPEWLSTYINSSLGRQQISISERGLAQKHFGVAAMRDMRIPLPPVSEQRRFVRVIELVRKTETALTENIGRLQHLKTSMFTLSQCR